MLPAHRRALAEDDASSQGSLKTMPDVVITSAPRAPAAAALHGARVFSQPTCHHRPEVYGGIRESEAAGLLRTFFGEKR